MARIAFRRRGIFKIGQKRVLLWRIRSNIVFHVREEQSNGNHDVSIDCKKGHWNSRFDVMLTCCWNWIGLHQ